MEPIPLWSSFLNRYYTHPNAITGLALQRCIFLSTWFPLPSLINLAASSKFKIAITERSPLDTQMFIDALSAFGCWSHEAQLKFTDFLHLQPVPKHHAFIYLRVPPEVSLSRCITRNRSSESSISIDYLKLLHEKHEAWFVQDPPPVVYIVDASKPLADVVQCVNLIIQDILYNFNKTKRCFTGGCTL